jgi:hypothetical protein
MTTSTKTFRTSGRIWLLISIWVAIGPTVVRRLRASRRESTEFHHQTSKG